MRKYNNSAEIADMLFNMYLINKKTEIDRTETCFKGLHCAEPLTEEEKGRSKIRESKYW